MKHYATRAQRHTSPAIKGAPCDGCRCCCVIHRGKRIVVEEYYCEKRHAFVDPHAIECSARKPEDTP